jgi:hypothetical protein
MQQQKAAVGGGNKGGKRKAKQKTTAPAKVAKISNKVAKAAKTGRFDPPRLAEANQASAGA